MPRERSYLLLPAFMLLSARAGEGRIVIGSGAGFRVALGALMLVALGAPACGQQAAGDWHGTIAIGAITLRIGVTLTTGADGTLAGTLVSPDQGPQTIPVEAVQFAGTSLSFTAPTIKGSFAAIWDPARAGWAGTWTQGAALPLVLLPGKVAQPERP